MHPGFPKDLPKDLSKELSQEASKAASKEVQKETVPLQATMEQSTKSASGGISSSGKFFRDAQHRTRIEHGGMASVNDPVKDHSFMLNMPHKIAIPKPPQPPQMPKLAMPHKPDLPKPGAPGGGAPQMQETADLGKKMVNGVMAHGKRYMMKVPGKPQPMAMETWTSHELQLPVKTSVADPATRTISTTQFKDIVPHAKLDPGMFKIPPDFKIMPPPKLPAPKLPAPPLKV